MTDTSPKERPAIDDLLEVMARLRDPENGCPWDREQTFSTIAPYTIEEAYEVADAIETGDVDQLEDELGDLLFQVVFYAQISVEAGGFDFDGVARRIAAKMRDRHPHVFGGGRTSGRQAARQSPGKNKRPPNATPAPPNRAVNRALWTGWHSLYPR